MSAEEATFLFVRDIFFVCEKQKSIFIVQLICQSKCADLFPFLSI